MMRKCIIISIVSFAVLLFLTFILPDKIAVNNGFGGNKAEISVYFIFLLTPIPALCYWSRSRKKK